MKNFPEELMHGSGRMMILDPTRLLLAFREGIARDEVGTRIDKFGLLLEDAQDSEQDKQSRSLEAVNQTDRHFWVRSLAGRPITEEAVEALQNRLADALDWVAPVYRLGEGEGRGGLLCPLPHVLLIKPSPRTIGEKRNKLAQILQQCGLKEVAVKSAYLNDYSYHLLDNVRERNAYQLRDVLLCEQKDLISDVRFENMPMLLPYTLIPNDPQFAQQWNMTRIGAGGPGTTGWDLGTGDNTVVIAIIDTGCDLTHPDLNFLNQGINLGTMGGTGAPVAVPTFSNAAHGTCCAGIAAAVFNNGVGIAGVAGNCRILPLALSQVTAVEVANGINWAAQAGAHVISMSFGQYDAFDPINNPGGWDFDIIWLAIVAADMAGCVIVAATGNNNRSDLNHFPARHRLVIGVGGSDRNDDRKTPASPDGENWGANFGPGISVVAPSVQIPTTDRRGTSPNPASPSNALFGYNANGGRGYTTDGVFYPNCGDPAGDYFWLFNGTSAAAPHVAGLAAALFSRYPGLTNRQVRDIIERTADKVGHDRWSLFDSDGNFIRVVTSPAHYADEPNFFNGTRNRGMGYGRINMYRALDFADVFIKDWPGDKGDEPSAPPGGAFWLSSDMVVRSEDDGVFAAPESLMSSFIWRGQDNFLYVRMTNNGPNIARGVSVTVRIVPYVGLEFVYADWIAEDATHISPVWARASFPLIPPGESRIAAFRISRAQVEALWGSGWQPTLLALATAQNDYAFETSSRTGEGHAFRRNNLAQRNVSVVELDMTPRPRPVTFPFLAGHVQNGSHSMEILVDRSRLPEAMPLLLALADDGRAFPLVHLHPTTPPVDRDEADIVFLERTRIEATLGGHRGVLTLEKGSRFGCSSPARIGNVSVQGGEVILRDNKSFVEIREEIAVIRLEKQPNQQYPLALHTTIPAETSDGDVFPISVAQCDERGQKIGGATVVYAVGSGLVG